MLEDIGPWDFTYGETPEELLCVEPDGKIIVGDLVLDGWKDVVRRIKATSHLSAEDAMRAAEWPSQVFDVETCMALKAYARALEGSDEV